MVPGSKRVPRWPPEAWVCLLSVSLPFFAALGRSFSFSGFGVPSAA